jgi:DNA-damage-inducible protein J
MFLQQVCFHQGLPFEVKLPNAQTVKAMEDVENGVDLTTCDSAEEMFEILDI